MEVVLLEKMHRLGDVGDRVRVRPGYARNYLVPNRKALPCTKENLALAERKREEWERARERERLEAHGRAERLSGLELVLTVATASEGRLHGSVGPAEIVRAAAEAGFVLEKNELHLPGGRISQLGDYPAEVRLYPTITARLLIKVVADNPQ